jgi:transposase
VVKDIRGATRRHFSAEDKIRIVLEGLRGDESIAELCRRKASPRACITLGRRSSWKPASVGWPVTPPVPRPPAKGLRRESRSLKEAAADPTLENLLLKESIIADGDDEE